MFYLALDSGGSGLFPGDRLLRRGRWDEGCGNEVGDLRDIFGIELDTSAAVNAPPTKTKKKAAKKTVKKASKKKTRHSRRS